MSTLEEHEAEQAEITAMCEAGECDHPECHEKEWVVVVTRDVTASRAIKVRAASEGEASGVALRVAREDGDFGFMLDDGNIGGDTYVTDVEEVQETDITLSNAPSLALLASIRAEVLENMRTCFENGHMATLDGMTAYEVVREMVEQSGVENVSPHIEHKDHPCVVAACNAVAEFRTVVAT